MSLTVIHSRASAGVNAPPVAVEVHLANRLPAFTIAGLPEAEVKERKERLRAALQNARFEFPARCITDKPALADLPKESGRFDLPIALGILAASEQIPGDKLNEYAFAGEVALTGALRPVRSALAIGCGRAFVLPLEIVAAAARVENATVYAAMALLAVCAHLAGQQKLVPCRAAHAAAPVYADVLDVKGQGPRRARARDRRCRRAQPADGKPAGARQNHARLATAGHSAADDATGSARIGGQAQFGQRGLRGVELETTPYRAPHHTASAVVLVGGGNNLPPGEISMAMHGVLLLDELPEFQRSVLEVLRKPLESGHASFHARRGRWNFPRAFSWSSR